MGLCNIGISLKLVQRRKAMTTDIDLPVGYLFDNRYEIRCRVAEGGFGIVYVAMENGTERQVAIKLLKGIADAEDVSRFKREAKILNEIRHSNIVNFYRYGIFQGHRYLVMEWIEGKTLSASLQDGPLEPHIALRYAIQICDALHAVHLAGVVHRDLKPTNIMLCGEPSVCKLVDFGLSRVLEESPLTATRFSMTKTGLLIGSAQYMSPEQCIGQKADQRSDIYSLGCIIFEMLTGQPVFLADNTIALLAQHISSAPPELEGVGVSPTLQYVISHALEKNRDQRYQKVLELKFDLEAILAAGHTGEKLGKRNAPVRTAARRGTKGGVRSDLRLYEVIMVAGVLLALFSYVLVFFFL